MAGTWIHLTGRVAPSANPLATFTGDLENTGLPRATLTGSVSRARMNAFESTCLRTGYRVKLNGAWVPTADLVGELEIRESLDSPLAFFSFGLTGTAWGVMTTRETWTRVPVEVWTVSGPPGEELEELRIAGYVMTSRESGLAPVLRVECGNHGILYQGMDLCYEAEPLVGMTRGEHVLELALDVGIPDLECPAGAEYTKPVQAVNAGFFDYLRDFIEPEGWKARFDPATGNLVVWRPQLRAEPEPADDVWSLADGTIAELEIEPPSDVPSRYVLRGFGVVRVDELGQVTTTTVVEISREYAVRRALSRQESDGSVTDLGRTPYTPTLQLVQRLTDIKVERNGLLLSQETIDEGWHNPAAAHRVTDPDNSEIDYVEALIDEDGNFVRYDQEIWGENARRRVDFTYDVDGSRTAERTQVWRWNRRTKGIQGVEDAAPSVFDAWIYGDGGSFYTRWETYELAEEHRLTATFATEGYEALIVVDSYGYYSERCAITPAVTGRYLRSDGQAQVDLVANWQRYARSESSQVVVDGTLVGRLETKFAWTARAMLADAGDNDWGDFSSQIEREVFAAVESKREQFNVLSTESWERVTYQDGQEPKHEVFAGRIPPPRWQTSPWTVLRQDPLEVVVDDPTLEDWFGFRREVLSNDFVQTLAEARAVVDERRARALAPKVRVRRHESAARVGDTILLVHPGHALRHRAMLVESATRRSLTAPAQLGDYLLEVRAA